MIGFLKTFLFVFIKQVLFLVAFGFSVSVNSDGIIFIPTVLLIIYLILYFKYSNKVYNQLKLDKNSFNLYYFISWIIIGILITYLIFTESWIWNILPTSTGMFSGLEYILVPILLIIYLIVWGIIKIGIYVFLKLKSSYNSKIF